MLDLDVTGTCSGPVFVDHCNGGFIVNVQQGWTFLQSIKFLKNIAEIFGSLGTSNSSVKLGFSRAGGDNGLDTTLPCDGSTAENM